MPNEMRRALASVVLILAALASPAAASADSPAVARARVAAVLTLEYTGPTATISRGDPLTFAVRTAAPAGSVMVRVAGALQTDADGLLTGPDGTWLDEVATPVADGHPGMDRAAYLGVAPAARALLLAGVRAERHGAGGRTRAEARGHAAGGRSRAREPVPPLRPQGREHVPAVLGEPAADGLPGSLPKGCRHDGIALGSARVALDDRRRGRAGRSQRRRVLARRSRRGLGRRDRLPAWWARRGTRPRAEHRPAVGARPCLSGARPDRSGERPPARARPHGGQQAPSPALRQLADDRGAGRRASGGAAHATTGSRAARPVRKRPRWGRLRRPTEVLSCATSSASTSFRARGRRVSA